MGRYEGQSRLLRRGFLAPTEQVLLETHASKWFFFPGPIGWLIASLAAVYVTATGVFRELPAIPLATHWLASVRFPFLGGTLGLSLVLLFLSVVAALAVSFWLVRRMFDWASDVYAVTNERLIKQHGIVTHDFQEIPLHQVHTVEVHQKKLAARILGYGTLEMDALANVANSGEAFRSGGRMLPNRFVDDPYINPRRPEIDEVGVEKWFSVPDPLRIQQTIEKAGERSDPVKPPGP